jgi:hypothetical protein
MTIGCIFCGGTANGPAEKRMNGDKGTGQFVCSVCGKNFWMPVTIFD